jgi:AcrR family transcriptional regulator
LIEFNSLHAFALPEIMSETLRIATDEAPPHLRPRVQARGEDTRRRLIETAITAFGELGYEGTSTRLLAERAGANLPAIQYHFGGKEGLYRAAVDHIAHYIEEQMSPVSERMRVALADNKRLPRSAVSGLLKELLDAFVLLVFGGEGGGRRDHMHSQQLFIARAEVEKLDALESLYETMRRCVGEPCSVLIGRLIGRSSKDEQTRLRTVAIIGQATVFCCKPARRTLGWDEFSGGQVRAVQKIVGDHTSAIFDVKTRSRAKSRIKSRAKQ